MPKQFTQIDDEALVWITKLNSGNVTQTLEQEFFAWLNTSDSHQAAYIRAEALWQRGAVITQLCPSDHACTDRAAKICSASKQSPSSKKAFKTHSKPIIPWAVAACALAAVVAGYFMLPTQTQRQHLVSAIGEQKEYFLEDGSRIILNTNTELDIELTHTTRKANLLRGEVYFDVQPNPKRPFDVHTNTGMVRVLGTHFSVRQLPTDVRVTVEEGLVALGANTPQQTFTPWVQLKTNQQLSFKQAQAGESAQTISSQSVLAWRNKQLVFKKQPLAAAIDELMRYYDVTIQIDDPAIQAKEITAVIQLHDLTNMLGALCQPLNLQAEFSTDKRIVRLTAKTH